MLRINGKYTQKKLNFHVSKHPTSIEIVSVRWWLLVRKHAFLAVKMSALRINRQFSTLIGVCSLSEGCSFRMKIRQRINIILVLTGLVSMCWFSLCYVFQHLLLGDIEGSLAALKQVLAVSSTLASFTSLVFQMRRVRCIFDRIQNMFKKCK